MLGHSRLDWIENHRQFRTIIWVGLELVPFSHKPLFLKGCRAAKQFSVRIAKNAKILREFRRDEYRNKIQYWGNS